MLEKVILVILFSFGIYYFTIDVNDYWAFSLITLKKMKWAIGFLAFLLLLKKVGNRFFLERISHINTFFHELSHALAAILSGGRVVEFNVNHDTSGNISHYSKLKAFIALAPYTIPWISIFIFLIFYFAKGGLKDFMFYFFSFSFANYFYRVIKETRAYQSDLKIVGLGWSVIIIIMSNLFFIILFSNFISKKY